MLMKIIVSWRMIVAIAVVICATARTSSAQDAESAAQNSDQSASQTEKKAPASETEGLDDANPSTLKAIDLYVDGDVDGAYALFKEVYDANPDSDPPGVLLALLHSHAERFLEMRRALEKTAEDYPGDPEAFLQLASVDVKEGRFLEAELLLERAERLIDEYPTIRPETTTRQAYFKEEALTIRADLAEKRGRDEVAIELVRKLIEMNPDNPTARWDLGYLLMKSKDYDAAEKAFDEAAARNSELWPGWLQVVSSLDREDKIDEAVARLDDKAELVGKASPKERGQLARLYLRFGKIDEAVEIIKKFENESQGAEVDRWILPGWLALYANQYEAAEGFFRNAVVVEPENFEATNGLALALLDQKNREKIAQARKIAMKNYRDRPDSIDAASTYAWTLFLSGAPKEADAIFQPILDAGKLNATTAYYLAEIANLRDDLDLAQGLLRLALSQKANFPKRVAAMELNDLIQKKLTPPEDPVEKDFNLNDDGFGEFETEDADVE